MRVLLDESVPRQLRRFLRGHEVRTVQEMGWSGKSNGELLAVAGPIFDVFLTVDQNIAYQQNLRLADIPILVLAARTNRLADLQSLIAEMLASLNDLKPGDIIRIALSDETPG